LCTTTAMAGWLVLLASPIAPTFADRVSGFLIPTLLAIVYAGLVMAFWTRAKGGFDSLPNVMRLCTKPEISCGCAPSRRLRACGGRSWRWRWQNRRPRRPQTARGADVLDFIDA